MTAEELLQQAEGYRDKLVQTRHFLHTHPGTGFDIAETVAFVKKELTDMGYEPKECGKAGLVATVEGKKPGKVFLLRADMDALPIKEEAEVDFASENGICNLFVFLFGETVASQVTLPVEFHQDFSYIKNDIFDHPLFPSSGISCFF